MLAREGRSGHATARRWWNRQQRKTPILALSYNMEMAESQPMLPVFRGRTATFTILENLGFHRKSKHRLFATLIYMFHTHLSYNTCMRVRNRLLLVSKIFEIICNEWSHNSHHIWARSYLLWMSCWDFFFKNDLFLHSFEFIFQDQLVLTSFVVSV